MLSTGAIVLAAGSSSRLGRPKQLITFRGESLIRRAARTALDAGCQPVVVVVGHNQQRIADELAGLPVLICRHSRWHEGIGSSLKAGLKMLTVHSPTADSLITMVSDQLFVTTELLSALIERQRESELPITACEYAGTLGVPALFGASTFHLLAELADDGGAKVILNAVPQLVTAVPFLEGGADIDTPEDVVRWLSAEVETQ